jgi:hypothetical protein
MVLLEPITCSFPGCTRFGLHNHHITYEPEVTKPLCVEHHEEITILNGQQARKIGRTLSNKHRWWIWFSWTKGELRIRRTKKAMEYIEGWTANSSLRREASMPQTRETGARASRFGHQNGTMIIAQLGGTNRKPGSNEFDLKGQRVSVHSAHYRRAQSVGVTRKSLKAIKSVLGAFQEKNGSYRILKLPADRFEKSSRPTASRGRSSGRVLIVKRLTFEEEGTLVKVLPARES